MTLMGGAVGQEMGVTVKPMVVSVKTNKVFVVLKAHNDMVSGEQYVFIARPRHLNDMRRIKRDKFERLFKAFNEPLSATDARVAFTDQDFAAALEEEGQEQETTQETPAKPDTTLTGDASQPTQPVTPPKRRGRPKGSKNKKTLEREAAAAAAKAQADREAAARAAGVLPQLEGETEETIQKQSSDTTLNSQTVT